MENFLSDKQIKSPQNGRIKRAKSLRDKKNRDVMGLFGVEGLPEIGRALSHGFELSEFYYCEDLLTENSRQFMSQNLKRQKVETYSVSKICFRHLVLRENQFGVFAIFKKQTCLISNFRSHGPNNFYLALEGIEKPGNLGAILRSADAAGASGVILLPGCCDPYNPGVIRSSIGCVFSMPTATATIAELSEFVKNCNCLCFAAARSQQAEPYTQCHYHGNICILLGNEAHGLSQDCLDFCGRHIFIPMRGAADSLNVSVAAAILLYEAARNREGFQDEFAFL